MTSGPGETKRQARERVAAQRQAEAAAARKRERTIRVVAVVAVIALVIGGGALVAFLNRPDPQAPRPAGVTSVGGGIPVGPADAVVIDLYEDFQCPVCGELEKQAGESITSLVTSGKARVVYHPMSFIGPESVRAANAFGCAADEGKTTEYHNILFANQPPERTGGFTNDELVKYGQQVGITGDGFTSCVNDSTYKSWVEAVDVESVNRGVAGTPTIFVDGKELERENVPGTYSAKQIEDAVAAAAGQ